MTTDMKAAERKNDLRRILSDREGDVTDSRLEGMLRAVGADALHHQVWAMLLNLLAAEPPTPKLSATKLCTLLAKAKALVKVHRPVDRVRGWQVVAKNTRTEADEEYGKIRALMVQWFRDAGGPNYCGVGMKDATTGEAFEMTLQRVEGDSPQVVAGKLRAELAECRAALESERQHNAKLLDALAHAREWMSEDGCDCGSDEPGTCGLCQVVEALEAHTARRADLTKAEDAAATIAAVDLVPGDPEELMASDVASSVARWLVRWFREKGASNFASIDYRDAEHDEWFEIIAQRRDGQTPKAMLLAAERERDEARAEILALRKHAEFGSRAFELFWNDAEPRELDEADLQAMALKCGLLRHMDAKDGPGPHCEACEDHEGTGVECSCLIPTMKPMPERQGAVVDSIDNLPAGYYLFRKKDDGAGAHFDVSLLTDEAVAALGELGVEEAVYSMPFGECVDVLRRVIARETSGGRPA